MILDAKIPDGPIEHKWQTWLDAHGLVGPSGIFASRIIRTGLRTGR